MLNVTKPSTYLIISGRKTGAMLCCLIPSRLSRHPATACWKRCLCQPWLPQFCKSFSPASDAGIVSISTARGWRRAWLRRMSSRRIIWQGERARPTIGQDRTMMAAFQAFKGCWAGKWCVSPLRLRKLPPADPLETLLDEVQMPAMKRKHVSRNRPSVIGLLVRFSFEYPPSCFRGYACFPW